MPDDPYRPAPPEADAELARLVAEGHKRREQAHAEAGAALSDAETENLRIALGSRGWSPVKRALVALAVLGALMAFVPSVVDWVPAATLVQMIGIPLFIAGLALASSVRGGASAAQVAAERAWVAALPFELRGYFEVLGVDPERHTFLVATLDWEDPRAMPAVEMLRNLAAVHDTRASAAPNGSTSIVVRSGPVDTQTDIRVNKTRWLYDNTKFVAYIHGLVDRVLLPLHRAHPMLRVSLTRD